MTGYYSRFVRDYATVTEPLTELLKKNSPEEGQWDVRTELAFQETQASVGIHPTNAEPLFC